MDRPDTHIGKLILSLITSTEISSIVRIYNPSMAHSLSFSSDDILVVLEGNIRIRNRSSNLLLVDIKGPYILKLIPTVFSEKYLITDDSKFSYITIPRALFFVHIEKNDLWQYLFSVLSYTSFFLCHQLDVMKLGNLYDVVKHYLYVIKCNADIMHNENVCNYIINRTGYSKSGVMTILKELKKGGYIELKKGKLLWIKALPLRF